MAHGDHEAVGHGRYGTPRRGSQTCGRRRQRVGRYRGSIALADPSAALARAAERHGTNRPDHARRTGGRRTALARNRIVLDSSAVSAFADGNEALRVALREALKAGAEVVVPTVVIAESTTGDGTRDVRANALLKAIAIVDLDERIARDAAALRYARRRSRAGTIDAIVVATADRVPGTRIITGDRNDLAGLADVIGRSRVSDLRRVR
jgi:predicted nucleic acid-binding protein